MEPIENSQIRDAKMDKSSVHDTVYLLADLLEFPGAAVFAGFFQWKEPLQKLQPDENVAYSATTQAAILIDEGHEKVQDVTPLPLGLKTTRKIMIVLILRNTTNPTLAYDCFDILI